MAGRTKLLAVAPETVEPKKPKVLIYGGPGVRKTWISCDFPHTYYIDTEGGADLEDYRAKIREGGGVYMGQKEGSLDFDTVIGQIQALSTEDHPYRTLVIDSVSKLWNNAISEESETLGKNDVFGASKKAPTRKFMTMVRLLNRLDMTAILIAQEKEKWGVDDNKQRTMVGYTYDCQEKLEHELHLSLRIASIGVSSYAYVGKSRLKSFVSGSNFPWTYNDFAERYGRDVIERQAEPQPMASETQLREMAQLLELLKVPDGWEAAVLKKEDVETWAELAPVRIDIHLNYLRSKLVSTPDIAIPAVPRIAVVN